MVYNHIFALIAAVGLLAACEGGEGIRRIGPDKSIDGGLDAKHLSQLKAGVWIDPEGCDHWMIDDGMEGYLSARLDDQGRPVCSGAGPASTAVGAYKAGTWVGDSL